MNEIERKEIWECIWTYKEENNKPILKTGCGHISFSDIKENNYCKFCGRVIIKNVIQKQIIEEPSNTASNTASEANGIFWSCSNDKQRGG